MMELTPGTANKWFTIPNLVPVTDDEASGVQSGRHQAGPALHGDAAGVAGAGGERRRQVGDLEYQTLGEAVRHQDRPPGPHHRRTAQGRGGHRRPLNGE